MHSKQNSWCFFFSGMLDTGRGVLSTTFHHSCNCWNRCGLYSGESHQIVLLSHCYYKFSSWSHRIPKSKPLILQGCVFHVFSLLFTQVFTLTSSWLFWLFPHIMLIPLIKFLPKENISSPIHLHKGGSAKGYTHHCKTKG